MSLTKESFEEAKKKARERIAEWVSEVKAAGISRLRDRYDETFTCIEWKKKESKSKITKQKKTKSKVQHEGKKEENKDLLQKNKDLLQKNENDQKVEEDGVIDGIHNIRDIEPCSPDRTHSRQMRKSRATSRCRSRAKSRQTPERCQSSRQTSERRTGSRKRYRDSASLIFGDNRNNRSSMFNSACSLDAISLLPEANSEIPDQTFTQKSKSSIKANRKGKRKQKSTENTGPVNILVLDHHNDAKLPVKQNRSSNPSGYRDRQRKMSLGIFPTNFKKRRRTKDTLLVCEENDFFSIQLPSSSETNGVSSATTAGSSVKILESDVPLRPQTDIGNAKLCPPTSQRPATMSTSSRRLDQLAPKDISAVKAKSGILIHALSGIKSSLNARRVKSGRFRIQNSPPGKAGSSSEISAADKELRRKNAIKRFRLLVRKIMCVVAILKTSVKNVKQNLEADKKKAKKKSQMLMTFDPTHFSSATTYGDLSKRSRAALEKQPQHRTTADIRILTEVMCRLPFFVKYPHIIKVELARIVWYDCYEKGRIIIRQGDVGNRMYFIVSGAVSVHRMDTDPKTDEKVDQHVRDITEGSTFGELALIRNISRTYTAICKGQSEFLSVGKEEFNLILRNKWEESWHQRLNFLSSSKYFQSWTTDQQRQTADVSNIMEYNANSIGTNDCTMCKLAVPVTLGDVQTYNDIGHGPLKVKVIFGDEDKLTEYVYFIIKGQCQLVCKLHLVNAESPYQRPMLLLPEKRHVDKKSFLNKPYGKRVRKINDEIRYLTVMTLHPGDYFGVGENMKNAYILSKTKVECLQLNAASFSIHSKREDLCNMKHNREKVIPCHSELHRRYEINRRWKEYKQKVVNEVVRSRAIPNPTSYDDVPETIKLEPGVPWDLIR